MTRAITVEMATRVLAFGYGLLVWGIVDRPLMIIVASAFIICGYVAQASHNTQKAQP